MSRVLWNKHFKLTGVADASKVVAEEFDLSKRTNEEYFTANNGKLMTIKNLKKQGYRMVLLSNTNPYVSAWTDSEEFSGDGHPIGDYFDAMYRSYEVKYMKPDENFFRYVIAAEKALPEECLFIDDGARNCCAASEVGLFTYCPKNGEDWCDKIYDYLK